MTLSITLLYHNAECRYAECLILFIIALNVIMLSVVVPNVIMQRVVILNVVVPMKLASSLLTLWVLFPAYSFQPNFIF